MINVELTEFEVEFINRILSQITVSAAAQDSSNIISLVQAILAKLTKN